MENGDPLTFWQEFFVKFYQAFIEADRWKQYLEGVGTTLYVTALALLLGIVLGVVVAIVRTAHDQQRPKVKPIKLSAAEAGRKKNIRALSRIGYILAAISGICVFAYMWLSSGTGFDHVLKIVVSVVAGCAVDLGLSLLIFFTGRVSLANAFFAEGTNPILDFFNGVCKLYVTVIRGTPMMVQLLIMSFVIFSSSRDFTMVGTLTLGINSGAYVAEIIRGGLMSLDPGQMEAGRSLGLNYIDTMRYIVIPQAFKAILPSLGNEFIILLKDTSLITVIGGKELVYAAQGIYGRTYEQMFPLIGIACIYLLLVVLFSWLLGILERRLRQSDRR